jgi:hypothetical protein
MGKRKDEEKRERDGRREIARTPASPASPGSFLISFSSSIPRLEVSQN